MDSYLRIAQMVLQAAGTPLSARNILDYAYMNDIAPYHLYGRTQHKTLQARLSEDILRKGSNSEFIRTEPGIFYLRKHLATLNAEGYKEFHSRRRERDLLRDPVLAIELSGLERLLDNETLSVDHFQKLFEVSQARYMPYGEVDFSLSLVVWSYVIVSRGYEVLSYRKGRYRENRDSFINKQAVGFKSLLTIEDRTLFDQDDHGLISSGVQKTMLDLGMPLNAINPYDLRQRSNLNFLKRYKQDNDICDMIGVITFDCPDWFEPTARRLAINDLRWIDVRNSVNNIEDFDPWSQKIIDEMWPLLLCRGRDGNDLLST